MRDVESKILRIDDTLNEVENNFLAIVHDENVMNVELDVITLLLCLGQVKGSNWGESVFT